MEKLCEQELFQAQITQQTHNPSEPKDMAKNRNDHQTVEKLRSVFGITFLIHLRECFFNRNKNQNVNLALSFFIPFHSFQTIFSTILLCECAKVFNVKLIYFY